METKTFNANGTTLHIQIGHYRDNGHLAISLVESDGLPYATLSVNIDSHLAEGEFFVKSWSENEALMQSALESGYFEDTGRKVPYGFVTAEVWRLTGGL